MAADEDAFFRLDVLRFAADLQQWRVDRAVSVTLDLLFQSPRGRRRRGDKRSDEEIFRTAVREAARKAIVIVDIVTEEVVRTRK